MPKMRGPGSVRIKVQACGICHSDSATKEGLLPGMEYPRVPRPRGLNAPPGDYERMSSGKARFRAFLTMGS